MEEKINILHLLGNTFGGVWTVGYTLMKHQLNNGYKVFAVIYSDQKEYDSDRIHYIKIDRKRIPGMNMLFGFSFSKIYKKLQVDYSVDKIVVHAHNVYTIGLISKIKDIPVVCTIHGACVRGKISLRKRISEKINASIIKRLIINGKTVVAVSQNTALHYQGKNKIKVIYNGIDISKKPSIIEAKNSFIIGHVGGVSISKGWDVVYEAFIKIKKNLKDVVFCSAGMIFRNTEDSIKNIDKKSDCNDIRLYGLIEDAGNSFIPYIDVMVLPSISEGMPMSILEAFAYGIPVIATDVGGIGEVINNNVNGFLIERDPNYVLKAIIKLYKDKNLYNTISKKEKEHYKKFFSGEQMSNNYEIEYRHQLRDY